MIESLVIWHQMYKSLGSTLFNDLNITKQNKYNKNKIYWLTDMEEENRPTAIKETEQWRKIECLTHTMLVCIRENRSAQHIL